VMATTLSLAVIFIPVSFMSSVSGRFLYQFGITAAAAVLARCAAGALDHCVAGHVSAEGAHRALLAHLGKAPLLDLGLRLGEGSGAALAIGVLKGALACHSGMSTFAEAGVAAG